MAAARRRTANLAIALLASFLVLAPATASAKSHQWKFTEFFSNPDGSVQFIEMFVFDPTGIAEWDIGFMELRSDANVWLFPFDLPMENTFQRWLLIATQDFADLPGAPTPDYIIPAGFFDPSGDTILYRTFRDTFVILPATMPVDGVHSLHIDLSTPINSPINFADEAGSVTVVVAPIATLPGAALVIGMGLLFALGGLALTRRSRTHATS